MSHPALLSLANLEIAPARVFALLGGIFVGLIGIWALLLVAGRRLPRRGDWLACTGAFAVLGMGVLLARQATLAAASGAPLALHSRDSGQVLEWMGGIFACGFYLDGLGALMLLALGVVSFSVHLYSTVYMAENPHKHVYFANTAFFTAAMLGLLLSDQLLMLFVFWELMGLASYLLIGHYAIDPAHPRRLQAAAAAKRAFLTTRIGDVCLLSAIVILATKLGTLRFEELWAAAQVAIAQNGGTWPAWLEAAGFLLLAGVAGKSAQLPFNFWLPDAMEGPSPVSAMIHAATMVAAGVFLLGRSAPLLAPHVLEAAALLGGLTALYAALVGLVQRELKAVLAWSTISQLGFMVAAVGLGGVADGLFHMFTHAFFKAGLFLAVGSVIYSSHHEQALEKLGGLRKSMPVTFVATLVFTLAICGAPLFSGFYSKDGILETAFENGLRTGSSLEICAALCLPIASLLTVFYMARLLLRTFFGEWRGPAQHRPHESPWPMTAVLAALAFVSVFVGHVWLLAPSDPLGHGRVWFEQVVSAETLYGATLAVNHSGPSHRPAMMGELFSVGTLLLSGGFAWWIYVKRPALAERLRERFAGLHHVLVQRLYLDLACSASAAWLTSSLARLLRWIDERVVDGLVRLVGWLGRAQGSFAAWHDRSVVDGCVTAVALSAQAGGALTRLLQTGRVQQYAAFALGGGLLAVAWLVLF